ncbi:MAG: hypothetical protein RBR43_06875 [Desulfuromonadaceae bacterium]|nr:hypothetical protein [Desulfuromonas sp.]MDY0185583.1 hypothetical protein [Desulfuromonadaceae bacterium]
MEILRGISILFLLTLPILSLAGEPTLVVHKSNPVTSLNLTEARNIFLGKKVFWNNGDSIEVFLQDKGEIHKTFALKTLGKSPRQLTMYWKRVLFSGEGIPPRKAANDHEMLELVAGNAKAIGYIDHEFIDNRIKAVAIIREE